MQVVQGMQLPGFARTRDRALRLPARARNRALRHEVPQRLLWWLALALSLPAGAAAEPPALSACVDRLDDAQVSEVLAFSEQSARQQRLGAALWFAGWSAFNVTNVSVGAWKLATSPDRVERDVWLMATIGAGGFLVSAAVMPLPGLYANLRLSRLPAAQPAQRRAKLRHALSLLERAARAEDRNSNLLAHLGGIFYAVLSAGYIWLHNLHEDPHQVRLAVGLQALNTIVGAEATIWSTPRRARRDLAQLRAGACRALATESRRESTRRSLVLAASLGSVGVRLQF